MTTTITTKGPLTPLVGNLDKPNSYVGRTLSRQGAKRAVAGRGRYTDDFTLPRMLHAAFLRSDYAHARIISIDTTAARKAPGVALVMTGAELAKMCTGPWVGTLTCFPGMKSAPQYPMAVDRACWHGEPIAMVVAETRALAEDAAELIEVTWQELPAVVAKETALDAGSPLVHDDLGDNLAFEKTIDTGGVDEAFKAAHLVVEETFDFARHTAVSLEPRAILADYDKFGERLTVWTSSQTPHMMQHLLARIIQIAAQTNESAVAGHHSPEISVGAASSCLAAAGFLRRRRFLAGASSCINISARRSSLAS